MNNLKLYIYVFLPWGRVLCLVEVILSTICMRLLLKYFSGVQHSEPWVALGPEHPPHISTAPSGWMFHQHLSLTDWQSGLILSSPTNLLFSTSFHPGCCQHQVIR